jgi:hypothetical protein
MDKVQFMYLSFMHSPLNSRVRTQKLHFEWILDYLNISKPLKMIIVSRQSFLNQHLFGTHVI